MDYLNRIEKLKSLLPLIPCEALLVEYPINLLYLTGLELSAGKLLISATETALLVDGRYIEICRIHSPCPVYRIEEMSLKDWIFSRQIKSLAFESDKTSYQNFLGLQKIADELQSQNLSVTIVPTPSPVQKLRWIKDADEKELLQEAAELAYEGYQFVVSQLREGVKESDLAFELEFFWKKKGAKRLAFDSIIAFGANSSMPHYRAGHTSLVKGVPVLIDIGVVWKHYHSDMTRTVFFGDIHPQIQEIYQIVEEAKERALLLCKPGTLIGELDAAARQVIASKGYGEYFSHSLGHGVGLEIHEPPIIRTQGPFSDIPLQTGMVITIEPGIYLPNLGGVRLEDTILITSEGYENLTD
jgi:Xaa-Pro aminopeptidase